MKWALTVFLLFLPSAMLWSGDHNGRGTRSIGLSGMRTVIPNDAWAIAHNPASLADVQDLLLSFFLIPQQFGMKELRTTAAAAVVPSTFGVLGVEVERYGFELYNETTIVMGFGRTILENVDGGMAIEMLQTTIQGYGRERNVLVHVGGSAAISEDVTVGFEGRNVTATTIGKHPQRLPQVFSMGIGYEPVKHLLCMAEIEKDIRYPLIVKGAVEQRFLGIVSVRLGVANNPDKISVGMSVEYALVEFGYAGYSHAQLGWTHQVDISVRIGGR